MVAGYCERDFQLFLLKCYLGPGCGMVHSAAALQPPLKAFAVFPDVMEKSSQLRLVLAAERLSE